MQPRIVVTRERPWRRTLLIALSVGLLAVAAWGLYSYTRAATVSGFASAKLEVEELRDERRRLTRDLRAAREEIGSLKEQVVYVQRSTEIDTQACESVRLSMTELQAEASDLREQLAFYRGIVAPEQSRAGVRVYEFKVAPAAAAGLYRYDLVLIQSVRHDRRVAGQVEIELQGKLKGADQRLPLAQLAAGETRNLVFSLKYFEEFSGEFRLPEGFVPTRVVVALVPAANGAPRIEEAYDWGRVLNGAGA